MAVFASEVSNIPIAEEPSRPSSPFLIETQTTSSTDLEDTSKISDTVALNSQYIFCSGSSGYSSSNHSPVFKDSFLKQQSSSSSGEEAESHAQKPQSKDTSSAQLPIPARKMAKPDSYKTVMCKGWLEMGGCSFGENCRFAHGEEELRPSKIPIDNPKYKTKLCDKYTKTGVCPYGDRCLFIHPKALDSSGFASNPYIHPDRMAQLLRERGNLLVKREQNQDTPLSSRMNARMYSWSLNVLKSFQPDKNGPSFHDRLPQSRTSSPSDTKMVSEIEKLKEVLTINTQKNECLGFEPAETLVEVPHDVTTYREVGLVQSDEETSRWSARISEVFDYAIETDNMARSLAKNLSGFF